jgi:hypothetical protein
MEHACSHDFPANYETLEIYRAHQSPPLARQVQSMSCAINVHLICSFHPKLVPDTSI